MRVEDTTVSTLSYDEAVEYASKRINTYLLERVPKFRTLMNLREKGWKSPAGDAHFAKQRRQADKPTDGQSLFFLGMMGNIARQIHDATGVFNIRTKDGGMLTILDMCMAPGAFCHAAMEHNPGARARAFSLPLEKGGHKILRQNPNVDIEFIDITMLGEDMGVDSTTIPPTHPDADEFLPRRFYPEDAFDLAICDGQVLRTHSRAAYRESKEPARLTMTQLAISLEHMKPGGTMLVLLHKVESWKSVLILRTFCKFSDVKTFKPTKAHATRSSCYMVASNIQPQHEDAIRAVQTWKQLWRAATFDTESEFASLAESLEPDVEEVLEDFGMRLVGLGKKIWETQARALSNASFVRDA
ncbi:hypothetical protein GGR58DRAFT_516043 [Xylaria digitata]|nr:hypothetical protein GGR58DRAFT_516043 [Xylaria digitata]